MATLYCPSRRVAVVHIPKTGGTSRESVLKRYGFGPQNWGSGHVRVCDFQRGFRLNPAKCERIIAVIRNPYEHVVSFWAFTNQQPTRGKPGDQWWHARQHKTASTVPLDWQCGPEQYYERRWHAKHYQHEPGSVPAERTDPFRYWLDIDGAIPANVEVVRLEDQEHVFSELLGAKITFPRTKCSRHGNWRDELTGKGIAAVNDLYEWTFAGCWYRQEVGDDSCVYSGAGGQQGHPA